MNLYLVKLEEQEPVYVEAEEFDEAVRIARDAGEWIEGDVPDFESVTIVAVRYRGALAVWAVSP